MILHASAAFTKRFKCDVSHQGLRLPQDHARLDGWSCHFIRLGTTPLVVAMHDATLYTLVIPAKGLKGFADLWRLLLGRIVERWRDYGAEFDPENQTVMVLPRTDRSRIGSMNDAIQMFRWHWSDRAEIEELEERSNRTPYKAIGYRYPQELLAEMLRAR